MMESGYQSGINQVESFAFECEFFLPRKEKVTVSLNVIELNFQKYFEGSVVPNAVFACNCLRYVVSVYLWWRFADLHQSFFLSFGPSFGSKRVRSQ